MSKISNRTFSVGPQNVRMFSSPTTIYKFKLHKNALAAAEELTAFPRSPRWMSPEEKRRKGRRRETEGGK